MFFVFHLHCRKKTVSEKSAVRSEFCSSNNNNCERAEVKVCKLLKYNCQVKD